MMDDVLTMKDYGAVPESAVAFEAGKKVGELESGLKIVEVKDYPFMVRSKNVTVEKCEELLPNPLRATGVYDFNDLDSFCTFINEFKKEGTIVFASCKVEPDSGLVFKGVINSHSKGTPGWEDFGVVLNMPLSDDYLAFIALTEYVSQINFVRTLRSRIHCVAEPDASDIDQIFADFSASKRSSVQSKIPISGGNYQITLTEEVNGNTNQSSVEVPTELVLILPFFKYRDSEEQMVELRALIDWKLSDNKLLFGLTFPRLEKIFCDEFSKIRAEIAKKTGLYVFV